MRHTVTIPAAVRPLLRGIGEAAAARRAPAYAVGGCVRDWLLGVPSRTDLDVAVEGDAIGLVRVVAHTLGAGVETHPQFGTATVRLARPRGRRIDFASCRRETYARPAAYPTVSAGTLEDDLFRRDFTINAMAVALDPARFATLVDPFHGRQDLRRKRLRMLHARSFVDDPSRILRGVRFAQRFGLRWERKTAQAARTAVAEGGLWRLNVGRWRKELQRLGEEPNPQACLRALDAMLRG